MPISYRKNELEQKMLLNVHKKTWTEGLSLLDFNQHEKNNVKTMKDLVKLSKDYNKMIKDESKTEKEKFKILNVGRLDPKRHIQQEVDQMLSLNVDQLLGMMLETVIF
jgi:26S proteasome regulatory subunit N11